MNTKNVQKNKGFVLLIAVVLSSLLLSIGLAIFNTTLKELELSSLGRDSQFAFYAADSGMECALYWDIRGAAFPTSTSSTVPSSGVSCENEDIATTWSVTSDSSSAQTTFDLVFPPDSFCATVVVSKDDDGDTITTTIESRGYNTCDTNNIRRVERAIRTTYE